MQGRGWSHPCRGQADDARIAWELRQGPMIRDKPPQRANEHELRSATRLSRRSSGRRETKKVRDQLGVGWAVGGCLARGRSLNQLVEGSIPSRLTTLSTSSRAASKGCLAVFSSEFEVRVE